MDDVAAAKEQVSFFSQGREGFSYVVGALRPFDAIDGELDDGDRGAWEHVDEDGPCAVVDAPVVVDGDVRQQGKDVVGEFLAAFGMVLDFVEFLRESVHIIDLARFGIALDVRPRVNQWAEKERMAFGFSNSETTLSPIFWNSFVSSLSSSAIIGLPCPAKITGSFIMILLSIRPY